MKKYISTKIIGSKVMVDETGNKDQTRDYHPYGVTRTASGTVSAYQFSGKGRIPMKLGWRSRSSGKRDSESDSYYSLPDSIIQTGGYNFLRRTNVNISRI